MDIDITANGHDVWPVDIDWDIDGGEHVWIPEGLAVAPVAGRLRRGDLQPGVHIVHDTSLARVESLNGEGTKPVRSPVDGTFLGWLAWEGENVGPGSLIARILRDPSPNNHNGDPR
jgi:hypothetical protein